MTFTITPNKQYNSIEIAFDCKPSEAVRTALKELKFRWHRAKKVWYGYATAEAATEAINAAESPLIIPESQFVDGGGMYDGWEGGNNKMWHDDKELKALLLADFKKAGIKATIRFDRGGYLTALTVTVKIPKSMIKPFEEYNFDPYLTGWIDYDEIDGSHQCIFAEKYWSLPDEERARILPLIKEYAYNTGIRHITESNTYSPYEKDILTAEGQKILDTAKEIVTSYNRDCTNSMIDYFDRDIYDSYAVKFID